MSDNPTKKTPAAVYSQAVYTSELRNPALSFLKSPTPTAFANSQVDLTLQASSLNTKVAVDPITLTINECMIITSAMRKMTRWSQSGVAAILGGSDLFGKDDALGSSFGLSSSLSASAPGRSSTSTGNPLLSSFIQLRSILTDAADVNDIDSLTLLQPFLMVVKSSSTSGYITSLALDSITKFIAYEIISVHSKNLQTSLIQIVSALTHCRFEAADQNSDDAVLLKVLRLVEMVLNSVFSILLPNEIVFEVVQTCLSLACNKKRSEVLRKAAEMTMIAIIARIFGQLRVIEPEAIRIDDLQTDFTDTQLPEDVIGSADADVKAVKVEPNGDSHAAAADTAADDSQQKEDADDSEEPFGIACLNDSLGILISMISPSNQYQHMESTRVLALRLINTAIEVSGNDIPKHASLMNLISDPVSKHVLQIITTADSPALLQAALQLFATLAIVLGDQLKSQIELTFTLLFKSILPSENKTNDAFKGNTTSVSNRLPSSKEMLLEALSLLWIREPFFFTRLYIDFDCDFDRSDLVSQLISFICKLALPESARITTDNVPPICLEGLLSFVSGINERIKRTAIGDDKGVANTSVPELILNKKKKNTFIKCTEIFNEKPANGLKALTVEGFIKDSNDLNEVSDFMYSKSGRLQKKVLGEYLTKQSNKELLKKFMRSFNFEGLRVDEALRLLLKAFRLPGESQQIERVVETFAERYVECQENYHEPADNGEDFVKPARDDVFVLSYSVIMLNTDLHNPVVKQQMTLDAYKKNLTGTYKSGNYPDWYLSRIYQSIKDKEIIMPEEHHGTNKWFDDVWHNLVSSQASLSSKSLLNDMTATEISQFDHQLFEENVDKIIETLIQVFKEASDDHIITRLMSTVDKCVNICLFYGINSSIDKFVGLLADLTSLLNTEPRTSNPDDNVRDDIPVTQIKIDKKDEAITVSNIAVWFGRDFKAQISTVVLFRLIKKTECKVTKSWDKVIRIILTLFEICLINPNLFVDFQKKLKLPPLPKVKPRYIINRAKPLKDSGLLSTFSSFLKGYSDDPPEPTDQEVESTLSSIDCVKSLNIASIFQMISHASNEDKRLLVELCLGSLPQDTEDNKRFYESEVLFIFELTICLCLLVNDPSLTSLELSKLHAVKESKSISRKGHLRILTYKLLLIRNGSQAQKAVLDESLAALLEVDKEILTKHGKPVLQPLISLVDDDSWCKDLLISEVFWKVLRSYGGIPIYSSDILTFVEALMKQSSQDVVPENSMLILGLLDEVSSLGAIAAQWEQETEQLHASGQKVSPNNDYLRELIDLSKKSIGLTADLAPIIGEDNSSKEGSYSLIQALAHQCFNPCREVRAYALSVLKTAVITTISNNENVTPYGMFNMGLFPLLDELSKPSVLQTDLTGFMTTQIEVLSLIGKVFLQHTTQLAQAELSQIWFKILDTFKVFANIRAKSAGNVNLIQESGSEILKNMILVLQSTEILSPEKDELWDATWEKVDAVCPELKQDLAPEPTVPEKSETEKNEKTTDAETATVTEPEAETKV